MFTPDFKNIVMAARNKETIRTPLYEHSVCNEVIEKIENKKLDYKDLSESGLNNYFSIFNNFFKNMGYDTVTYEECITRVLPGGGALAFHVDPVIKNRDDFEKYPFQDITKLYIDSFDKKFEFLAKNMPEGMKAIGGVGNGVFEIAQDLCGYQDLMLMSYDDPELYANVFQKVGDMMCDIWKWFMYKHGDNFCVLRFGDDLGFKSNTLIPKNDIITHIIPQYKKIVSIIHGYDKPFLFHSCGCIFDVMDCKGVK